MRIYYYTHERKRVHDSAFMYDCDLTQYRRTQRHPGCRCCRTARARARPVALGIRCGCLMCLSASAPRRTLTQNVKTITDNATFQLEKHKPNKCSLQLYNLIYNSFFANYTMPTHATCERRAWNTTDRWTYTTLLGLVYEQKRKKSADCCRAISQPSGGGPTVLPLIVANASIHWLPSEDREDRGGDNISLRVTQQNRWVLFKALCDATTPRLG